MRRTATGMNGARVDSRLLSLLACPWCLGVLDHAADRLKCRTCGAVYGIHGGVPNMRVDEADLFCPGCRGPLEKRGPCAVCPTCAREYRMDDRLPGIA